MREGRRDGEMGVSKQEKYFKKRRCLATRTNAVTMATGWDGLMTTRKPMVASLACVVVKSAGT